MPPPMWATIRFVSSYVRPVFLQCSRAMAFWFRAWKTDLRGHIGMPVIRAVSSISSTTGGSAM